jgi:hypothetical protein
MSEGQSPVAGDMAVRAPRTRLDETRLSLARTGSAGIHEAR